jgi:hypothetical protein
MMDIRLLAFGRLLTMLLPLVRAPDRDIPSRSTTPVRTRLGVGSAWPLALPNSASIYWNWAQAHGPVSGTGTLTKTSSSMSSEARSCSSVMLAKPSSTPAIAPVQGR